MAVYPNGIKTWTNKIDAVDNILAAHINEAYAEIIVIEEEVDTHKGKSATEAIVGHVELATAAEATAGTDNTKAIHPAGLKVELDKKISHSLTTAVNDFLVASGAGIFIKKTLAEVKTILGLGTAAATASTDYATAAQGALATNAIPSSQKGIAGGVALYDTVDAHLADDVIQLASKMPLAGGTYSGTVDHARNQVHQPQLQDYSEMLSTNAAATGAVTLNIANGNVFDITLTGATTLAFSNPAPTGQACSFTLIVRQDATARVITWSASVKWSSDIIPDISAVSKTSVFTFLTVNGGTRWYGFLAANGLVT